MVSQSMIINKVLSTKDYSIISLNNLDEKYFFNYQDEFNFIKNHFDKYNVVPDKLTFINKFQNFEVFDVNEPDSYLLEQLNKDYKQVYLAECFNKMRIALQNGNVENAERIFTTAYENNQTASALTCTNIFEDVSRYDRYLERTKNRSIAFVTTGFPELDEIIGGIDRKEENMVIIARTGQGKTQVLLKMAAAASMVGLRVGIYEGEMTTDKVGYRIDTFIEHIKNTSIKRGDLDIQREYKKYIDSLKSRDYGPIFVFTPNDVPSGDVTVDVLRAFIEKQNLDILFVDQYDLMEDNTKYVKAEHERVANIAKNVKKLQVNKLIPIISVCQQSRAKTDSGEQDTTQVAGSDKVPRYATTVLALEQKYNEAAKEVELDINIIKARDGGDHNKLKYKANFNTGMFKYINNAEDGVTTEEDAIRLAQSYEINLEDTELVFKE